MVIWILGLSGSGKTTLAKIINKKLQNKKFIHIDGDSIRKIYEKKLGHTIKDRLINAKRISQLVKFLSDQNVNIIVSVLSNFPKWLKWNRDNIKKYFEIYLKTDLKILKKRRPNLYSGKTKNVVGIDIGFNEPKKADMTINNCKSINDLRRVSKKIIKKIRFN
jgi:adenylylsulfate kinase